MIKLNLIVHDSVKKKISGGKTRRITHWLTTASMSFQMNNSNSQSQELDN